MSVSIRDGYLGIRCPEFCAYGEQNISSVIDQYKALSKGEFGERIARSLNEDSRVRKLSEKAVAQDFVYGKFNFESFLLWYLWRINNVGEKQAQSELEEYLNSDYVLRFATVWVSNITVGRTTHLFGDYYLIPFEEMPESFEKHFFHNSMLGLRAYSNVSTTALVKQVRIPKVCEVSDDDNPSVCDPLLLAVFETMQLANMFVLLNGSCSQADSHTFSCPDSTPFGFFANGRSSSLIPSTREFLCDVYEYSQDNDTKTIERLFKAFQEKEPDEQEVITRIIHRVSQAKNRQSIEDKILDLGIALEMLLLNDQHREELSYRFALRGAYLLESAPEDRLQLFEKLREFYALRSRVAHNGQLQGKKRKTASKNIDRYVEIAEQACIHMITQGWPDWNKLIMGA